MTHFPPHGFCLGWPGPPDFPPGLVLAHILGDLGGVLPYGLLALGVAWWTKKSWHFLPWRWKAIGCGSTAFLLLCGACHLMDILTLLWPWYYAQAGVKLAMGLAAAWTLALSWREIPRLRLAQAQLYLKQLAEEIREAADS